MQKKYKKVVIGGTFDILHKGHEALLRRAFSLGETTIGLTSNKMAEKIKRRRVGNFRSRKKELEKFIKKGLLGKYKIVKIEDKFGPTLKEDFDYIVVSPSTYKTALLINKKRSKTELPQEARAKKRTKFSSPTELPMETKSKKRTSSSSPRKKTPIKIVKIKFVLGENGKPISATQIIKGRINKQGKLITKSRLRDEVLFA